ncbi:hypothetical protein J437_LFUL005709 [Ladona fulva]|uniref:Ig-like domain-containing protein n=1 Tax=Ladona fulva TaxID=123851 RepID=A0A8K0K652_LADFU|nr:hypothetical protein J437_LFUL005709 [Ladona fulva]
MIPLRAKFKHPVKRAVVFNPKSAMSLIMASEDHEDDYLIVSLSLNRAFIIHQQPYFPSVGDVPPNILDEESTQSTVAVRENQNITLVCKADGFPAPKIMWRREDGQGITIDRRKKDAHVNVIRHWDEGRPINQQIVQQRGLLTSVGRPRDWSQDNESCVAGEGIKGEGEKGITSDV